MRAGPVTTEADTFERITRALNVAYYEWLPANGRFSQVSPALAELLGCDASTWTVARFLERLRTAMNRGAFDFLTKPIDFADLDATIAKTIRHIDALRGARASQAAAERAQATLARFFSPNLAGRLATDPDALAGQRRHVAAIFTDITGFTSLAERLSPDILSPLLNDYLGELTEIVFAHDGTLAKVVGDAMNILFGAPGEQPDYAARAVACALALDAAAETFRARWQARGIAVGATRIGVHAGPAIVGNFGAGRYFDYTAYGDTINTAARLEAANKAFGTRICVSAATAALIPEFYGRPIGDLLLRGRSGPLRAHEPLPAGTVDDGYTAAFALLETNDTTAIAAFAGLVSARPQDPLPSFHLRRLLNGESGARLSVAA